MGLFEFNDVGIDLGTSSVLVYVKGKGIVLREPSVVAVERLTGRILAIGTEARAMLGRTPGSIAAIRPLKDGVISNFDITERMLNHFIRKVSGRHMFFKPRVIVCVPSGVTEVEKALRYRRHRGSRRAPYVPYRGTNRRRDRRRHRHCRTARQYDRRYWRRNYRYSRYIIGRRRNQRIDKGCRR